MTRIMRPIGFSLLIVVGFALGARGFQQLATVQGNVTDTSGQPVPDALVTVSGEVGTFRVNSDSAGRFLVSELSPGEYKVVVARDGYYWSKSRSGPSTVTINGDLRNVSYRLLKGSAISGRILDHTGEPESGISVSVTRSEYRNGSRVLARVPSLTNGVRSSTSTDRKGEYRLYGLPAGEYYLSAGEGDVKTYYPGTVDLSAAVPLTLVPGRDLTGVNMTQVRSRMFTVTVEMAQPTDSVTAALGTVRPRDPLKSQDVEARFRSIGNNRYISSPIAPGEYELVWGSPLTKLFGRIDFDIVDHDVDVGLMTLSPGITIDGRVRLPDPALDLKGIMVRLNAGNSTASGFTAADGSFSISNVPEGQYVVDLTLPRGAYRDLYLDSVRYGTRPPERGDISVGKQPEGSLEIVLSVGRPVSGVVRNARGEVVPFSSVLIYPISGRPHPTFFKTTEADKDGAFTFTGVAPRDYRVLAWEDAFPSLVLDPKFLSGLNARATTVTVRSGASANVEVRIVPSEP